MREAAEQGVEADWEILQGEPAKEIIGFARDRDADLIVDRIAWSRRSCRHVPRKRVP